MIETGDFEYLARQLEEARVVLFMGAGFSCGAVDIEGRALPLGSEVADELWQLCFPNEPRDSSSTLQDLFEIALSKNRTALAEYLSRRFAVDQASLPDHFRLWLSMPWWRAYTLNIDDLELAARRKFPLPREIRSVSSPAEAQGLFDAPSTAGHLQVVHLNGVAKAGPGCVTFGTSQYARRIGGSDPFYPLFVAELVSHPCVFVGTILDESPLWQHIELRGLHGPRQNRELRRKSFLITTSISRAREQLLREYNVYLIRARAKEFADEVLVKLESPARIGLTHLRALASTSGLVSQGIPLVAHLAADEPREKSLYLLGDEPRWSDIVEGRAIERESDKQINEAASRALSVAVDQEVAGMQRVLLLSGTAGSGKSTAMMRLALRLTATGVEAGWVDEQVDASPRALQSFGAEAKLPVLFIDNAERYGGELASIVHSLVRPPQIRLLVLAMRATQVEKLLSGPRLANVSVMEIPIPPLADPDIDRLLDVLAGSNLLGRLRGMSRDEQRKALKEKADRQLLVAMIEATSGRRFEEKVFDEWLELSSAEREAYGLVAVAYALGFPVDKELLLVASGDASNDILNALEELIRRHVVRQLNSLQIRARHRLIADVLVEELLAQQRELTLRLYSRLAFAASVRVKPGERRSTRPRRVLRAILNHERLFRLFDYLGACAVYDEVARVLDWDYHYYLQRGSLELEYGQIRLAENFLEQARSLETNDPRVTTAYGYMLLKKAAQDPESSKAVELANAGIEFLVDQIKERGLQDPYPYHVLGSQGLAWARRGKLSGSERESLLKMLVKTLEDGLAKHPRQKDVKQLRDDLKKEELSVAVR